MFLAIGCENQNYFPFLRLILAFHKGFDDNIPNASQGWPYEFGDDRIKKKGIYFIFHSFLQLKGQDRTGQDIQDSPTLSFDNNNSNFVNWYTQFVIVVIIDKNTQKKKKGKRFTLCVPKDLHPRPRRD